MKTHIVGSLVLMACCLTMNAEASSSRLNCPDGSKTVLSCLDGTQPGDHEIAIDYMNEAIVCQKGSRFVMLLDGDHLEQPMGPIAVKRTERPGATAFSAKASDVEFVLSRMIINTNCKANGRFAISTQGITASRSLICE